MIREWKPNVCKALMVDRGNVLSLVFLREAPIISLSPFDHLTTSTSARSSFFFSPVLISPFSGGKISGHLRSSLPSFSFAAAAHFKAPYFFSRVSPAVSKVMPPLFFALGPILRVSPPSLENLRIFVLFSPLGTRCRPFLTRTQIAFSTSSPPRMVYPLHLCSSTYRYVCS